MARLTKPHFLTTINLSNMTINCNVLSLGNVKRLLRNWKSTYRRPARGVDRLCSPDLSAYLSKDIATKNCRNEKTTASKEAAAYNKIQVVLVITAW